MTTDIDDIYGITTIEIRQHAKRVVQHANKTGAIERQELTLSAARALVAKSMGLDDDALDAPEEKKACKEAVLAEIAALADESEEEEEEELEEAEVVGSDWDDAPAPKKRATKASPVKPSTSKASKNKTTTKATAKANTSRATETVLLSDDEGEEDVASDADSDAPSDAAPKKAPKPASKVAGNKQRMSTLSKETIESDSDGYEAESSAQGKRKAKENNVQAAPASPAVSEMSSVYDEPPAAKRRESNGKKAKTTAPKAKPTKKNANDDLSPDEARVGKLKKIVHACGVRKVWTKEFADYPTPRAQVSHLLSLLQGLGMKGQPTLGKAKELKETRELAAELNDVKEYEAARGLSSSTRPSRRRVAESVPDVDTRSHGAKEESAMAAVMDFLGDEDSD